MSTIMGGLGTVPDFRSSAYVHLLELEKDLNRQEHSTGINISALTALRSFIGADSAAVIIVDTTKEEWQWGDTYYQNLPLAFHQAYLDRFGYEDPVGVLSLKGKARKGDVLSHNFNPDDAKSFYERFYCPQDIHHILGLVITLDHCMISIGLHRRRDKCHFDTHAKDFALLTGRILASHYHRVSEVYKPTIESDTVEENIIYVAKSLGLSPREIEIVQLVEKGLTNGEIAQILSISVMTVQNHLRSIYRKVEVQNRASLIYELNCLAKSPFQLS